MTWIVYASIAAFSMAAADSFVKLAANRISSSLGLLIYGCCTFLTGTRMDSVELHSRGAAVCAAFGLSVRAWA